MLFRGRIPPRFGVRLGWYNGVFWRGSTPCLWVGVNSDIGVPDHVASRCHDPRRGALFGQIQGEPEYPDIRVSARTPWKWVPKRVVFGVV